jgi:hypothetical protein
VSEEHSVEEAYRPWADKKTAKNSKLLCKDIFVLQPSSLALETSRRAKAAQPRAHFA